MLRIKSNAFYVLSEHPGISGFKDWTRKDEFIITGLKARNNRASVVREYTPTGSGMFRMDDGHLPDYQPIAPETEALRWLNANPFQSIHITLPPTNIPQVAPVVAQVTQAWYKTQTRNADEPNKKLPHPPIQDWR